MCLYICIRYSLSLWLSSKASWIPFSILPHPECCTAAFDTIKIPNEISKRLRNLSIVLSVLTLNI